MADAPAAGEHATKGTSAFLVKKVGPLPAWAWMAIAVAVYLYYSKRQKSASATASGANQQTDPAGNVGSIDPATGYVYGTPEDQAALAANNSGSTGTGSAGTNATTGGQTYADNNAWGIAAVNYLVGLGIDATTANQAVQQYLSSQTLTPAQQGDINLVIKSPIGPPPSLPGPTSSNPVPVTTPGTGASVAVPNVVGRADLDTAEGLISAAGLKPVSNGDSGTGNKGKITSQSPAAGTKVAQGSSVTITYKVAATAKAPAAARVKVPNVVGKDVAQAATACAGAGLKMTPIPPAVKGKTHVVTSQSPTANSMVPKGATVTIKYKTTG